MKRLIRTCCYALTTCVLASVSVNAEDVSFSRDILPVLSDRCFHCHGPDEGNREADLRLDLEDAAKEDRGGYSAIVPGDLQSSELWNRITTNDQYEVMPPRDSHRKSLTDAELASIRQWIVAGAKWGKHWSFEQLSKPDVPAVADHPIDAFVQSRLADAGLKPSLPAAMHTQLRRLSFDLTGQAPSAEEVAAFDGSKTAWETMVDRRLQSPRYAERMAMWWLDAARYSDSDGFQQDKTRQNWPWRDWVIRQFQSNKSFRQFTIEQFAGDLLPDNTEDQILATCFHRNHMTNGEGGRDPEESRIDYVIDRVNTTGTVWLGLTLGCVQCHSHKFDPISQHDYYSLAAFFNSIDEDGKAGLDAKPYLEYSSPDVQERIDEAALFVEQTKAEEHSQRQLAEQRFETWLSDIKTNPPANYTAWWNLTPSVSSSDGTQFRIDDAQVVQTFGATPFHDDYRVTATLPKEMKQVSGLRLEVFSHDSHFEGKFSRDGNGEFALTSVIATVRRKGSPAEQPIELANAIADFESDPKRKTEWDSRYASIAKTLNDDARDGWTTEGAEMTVPHVGVYEFAESWPIEEDDHIIITLRHRSTHGRANIGRFRISFTSELGETVRRTDGNSPAAELFAHFETDKPLDPKLRQRLLDQFLLGDHQYQAIANKLAIANKQLAELKKEAKPRKVMVLAEKAEPRTTNVLVRGVWDAKGDVVDRALLTNLLDWQTNKPLDRLDLAEWIVSPDNPLTARVVVNHIWQIMFGTGLVRTPEDFGLQGQFPTHPRLLDWLAVELIEHDWDLQHIIRLIVTSDTYRQSSLVTPELLAADPENRLLARAPRFRLPAWMIRDNALAVSGLLNPAVGGPPVLPHQPEGIWAEITMGRFDYQPSLGPAQYRRTIYAFWRRSSAPPFLFDSAQRRVCEVGVRRTNTPLHALTLMNDTTMLEASRALAESIVQKQPTNAGHWSESGIQTLAVIVLSRKLESQEVSELNQVWTAAFDTFKSNPENAIKFCTIGQQPKPAREQAAEIAAWTTVASLMLNLDEAMTRE